jgi:hypothetical protein
MRYDDHRHRLADEEGKLFPGPMVFERNGKYVRE